MKVPPVLLLYWNHREGLLVENIRVMWGILGTYHGNLKIHHTHMGLYDSKKQ